MSRLDDNQGFVILYAVLLVSIVLTISLSLMNITYRQIILSQVARESVVAFAAADAGIDCARYWDLTYNVIKNEDPAPINRPFGYYDDNHDFQSGTAGSVMCSNAPVGGDSTLTRSNNNHVTTFNVEYQDDAIFSTARRTCAIVTVTKTDYAPHTGGYTRIDVFGYNTDCAKAQAFTSGGTPSAKLVERSLTTSY